MKTWFEYAAVGLALQHSISAHRKLCESSVGTWRGYYVNILDCVAQHRRNNDRVASRQWHFRTCQTRIAPQKETQIEAWWHVWTIPFLGKITFHLMLVFFGNPAGTGTASPQTRRSFRSTASTQRRAFWPTWFPTRLLDPEPSFPRTYMAPRSLVWFFITAFHVLETCCSGKGLLLFELRITCQTKCIYTYCRNFYEYL